MTGRYIYVITSYVVDEGGVICDEVLAYSALEDAQERFNLIVKETKETMPEEYEIERLNTWVTSIEDTSTIDYYYTWEDGNFSQNRAEITLRRTLIM